MIGERNNRSLVGNNGPSAENNGSYSNNIGINENRGLEEVLYYSDKEGQTILLETHKVPIHVYARMSPHQLIEGKRCLIRQKIRTSIEHKIDPKEKLLPWQQHSRCHFVSYLGYITGAKFEQHQSNISRDILDFVIYLCTNTICVIINKNGVFFSWISSFVPEIFTFLFQKLFFPSCSLWKTFQITVSEFLLHRHFKNSVHNEIQKRKSEYYSNLITETRSMLALCGKH